MTTRPPAVAGTFYPGVARELEATVSSLLDRAATGALPRDARVKALIVPHAGYVYSGPIAANAYAALGEGASEIRRVVLLGPAHRVPVRGLAVPDVDTFDTPLGAVRIDRAGVDRVALLPQVVVSDRAHALEHSLEVQLPFLQMLLGEFSLIPLVVGEATDDEVAEVLECVWGGAETLVLISSDLSHYADYATARQLDAGTCRAIEQLDGSALDWESACGRVPVRGLLAAARRHDLVPHTLDLRSSGDTAGDPDRVVGYGAWAFAPSPEATIDKDPDRAAFDRAVLDAARRAIEDGLASGREPVVDPSTAPAPLRAPGACFVTLRSPDGALRGCIGSLEPTRPLVEDAAHNAWMAAFRDPRMTPVAREELDALDIEVSLLGPREEIAARSLDDLVSRLRPGVDGLVLTDEGRRGTLLPQVWRQLPDARAFAGAVWQKAGLPADHWSPTVRAWRYTVREIHAPRVDPDAHD